MKEPTTSVLRQGIRVSVKKTTTSCTTTVKIHAIGVTRLRTLVSSNIVRNT